jgi:Kef-type K+ transport system membrane component KefB
MDSYRFLLDLALILIATKLLGLLSRHSRCRRSSRTAGRPYFRTAILNFIRETDFIDKTSEVGVIVLMFSAGSKRTSGT